MATVIVADQEFQKSEEHNLEKRSAQFWGYGPSTAFYRYAPAFSYHPYGAGSFVGNRYAIGGFRGAGPLFRGKRSADPQGIALHPYGAVSTVGRRIHGVNTLYGFPLLNGFSRYGLRFRGKRSVGSENEESAHKISKRQVFFSGFRGFPGVGYSNVGAFPAWGSWSYGYPSSFGHETVVQHPGFGRSYQRQFSNVWG